MRPYLLGRRTSRCAARRRPALFGRGALSPALLSLAAPLSALLLRGRVHTIPDDAPARRAVPRAHAETAGSVLTLLIEGDTAGGTPRRSATSVIVRLRTTFPAPTPPEVSSTGHVRRVDHHAQTHPHTEPRRSPRADTIRDTVPRGVTWESLNRPATSTTDRHECPAAPAPRRTRAPHNGCAPGPPATGTSGDRAPPEPRVHF